VFQAIPDETLIKKPAYFRLYKVSADITDNNGGTRSATTIVSVSFQAIQLTLLIIHYLLIALKNMGISSK
jgi:hypothetical protein